MNEQAERAVIDRVFGPFDEVRWRKRSHYAQIVGVTRGNEKLVVKLPVPWVLGRLCDDAREKEGEFLNRVVDAYLKALTAVGVSVPSVYELALVDGYPVHLISDAGEDCEVQILSDPSRLSEILRMVLLGISGMVQDDKERVGLDARLRNFGFSNRHAVYFDVFPPLVYFDGAYLVHYPNPDDPRAVASEVTRKFTGFGILRRFRFDLMVINPELEAAFLSALEVLGEPMRSQVVERFGTLPDAQWSQMRTSGQKRDFLRRIGPMDVDTMRDIAVRAIPLRGRQRYDIMSKVFVATSLAITRDPDEHAARLERYRHILAEYL